MAVISDSKFLASTVHCCVDIMIIVKGETRKDSNNCTHFPFSFVYAYQCFPQDRDF